MTTGSTRPSLDGKQFDIVVIGGGINGAAIAHECARAGKRVLVVEQHDFASGTTSRATRIIHGGLRYLEHGEIGLVRESLREREWMLKNYGHVVRPLNFLLAMPSGTERSALEIRFGLWLYRRFAGRSPIHDPKEDRLRLEQLLDKGQRWSIFAYEDAQCEYPERIVIEWLLEAASDGAVIRNYTEALEVVRRDGEVTGVRLRERLNQQEYSVSTPWVINATGPWADSVCRRSNVQTDDPLIGGVRGSHILLPTFSGAPKAAVYTEAIDGRPFFAIPWADQLLVGTTEVKDEGDPAKAAPGNDEISYLLLSLKRIFPFVHYGLKDVRAAFAGIRPLPFISEQSPSSITRRHFLVDHKEDDLSGMISVIGGKLTTAASLAREVARAVGIKVRSPKTYSVANLVEPRQLTHVQAWFGPAAEIITKLSRSSQVFGEPIFDGCTHTVGEAVYAIRNEHALTLADVLLRRVPVAFHVSWTRESAMDAAHRVGNAIGWNIAETNRQLENFLAEYDAFLKVPEHQENRAVAPRA
jgi:glycerol-3-phosphate dehydrogenase